MRLKITTILCLASLFFSISLGHASEAEPVKSLSKDWEKVSSEIEKASDDTDKLLSNKKEFLDSLRQIRASAQAEFGKARESLKSQNDLLTTLGLAPEGDVKEEKTVSKKRTELSDKISAIDAQQKHLNLMIAQIDDKISFIDSIEKKKLQAQLLSFEKIPLSFSTVTGIIDESTRYLREFSEWKRLIFLLMGFAIIVLMALPLTTHLNKLLVKAPQIELMQPFKRARLVVLGISAYFVFLMRFNLIDLQSVPTVENFIEVTASIILAIILFLGLGKIRFIKPELEYDGIGEHKKDYRWIWNGIKQLARLVLLAVPLISVYGYANLGLYLAFNILATFAAALIFVWLRSLFVLLSKKSSNQEKDEKELSPLTITVLEPVLALISILFALSFWGMTTEDVTSWIYKFKGGLTVGDVTIDLVNFAVGISLFVAFIVFTRLIQWFLASRVFPYTSFDIGFKDAVIAISGYLGMTLAFLFSIGAIGFDLSNLAIVLGALSVGIGFGLQAIFSNFVSGLILLFERPVKVGDWVVVGDLQGIIKKIRVRSTEIETIWNSSVIVPNSQLISETVTNWTLHDKVGRVDIKIGVAYGTDTEKVSEVLLNVAKEHSSVRTTPHAKVYFMNFGDSSLDFELRCFIRNIRDVFSVSSELRFAIDKAFKEHNIQIPFPQRDLHIVSSVPIDKK